ncbi:MULTISPECIES: hypothetical protein [Acinetobacter]|uniref:Uncharacterized protein n=1 Tax=Acinetobacter pseudolwoffii TaxID=2053287 RepID=A0A2H9UQW5_9GAMM|nr:MULTISPECIES: hypothetical protein [Acinetobacter]PJI34080.1 hypothetical protein CU320_01730 [Acinetobacter pseudolwoffii]
MTSLTIEQVSKSTLEVAESGGPILSQIARYMDAAEKLKNSTLSGDEKRDWVIAYAKKEIKEVFNNLDYWIPLIIRFINAVKMAFNLLKKAIF